MLSSRPVRAILPLGPLARSVLLLLLGAACLSAGPVAQEIELAAPGKPGWALDREDGCRIWNAEPQPAQEVAWKGPCPNGIARGRGELMWKWGSKSSQYVGEMLDGRRHGHGTFTFANGDRYNGSWKLDRFHGRGTLEWANKDKYEGEFKEGAISGAGVWTAANGDRYVGQFLAGKRHGEGEMIQKDGDTYIGLWRNDRPDGAGDGRVGSKRLLGEWKDGCFKDYDEVVAWGRPVRECR